MPRTSLTGKWRIATRPAILLTAISTLNAAAVWIPTDLELLRVTGLVCGAFALGMLASQHAAIWERVSPEDNRAQD